MATATLPVQPAARVRNTLEILRLLVVVLWVADIILLAASIAGVDVHRSGLKTVGKDAAPSIIAAQSIKAALADMDAQAANGLLLGKGKDNAAGEATATYEKRRQEAAGALITAAENITFGDSERKPIRDIQLGLGTYEGRIQRARDLYERNDPTFLGAYNKAAETMDSALLPAADALDAANLEVLESVYHGQSTRSMLTRGIVIVAAILLLFTLISVQTFLSRKTNRTLNLPLTAATLITIAWSGWAITTLSAEQRQLKVAKEDAFASIHALWQARSTAYSANAEESRYLLDRQGSQPSHAAAFQSKADLLLKVAEGTGFREFAENAAPSRKIPGVTGYLADELYNVTFFGEREAAVQSVLGFGEYLEIDRKIRAVEQAGKHNEAVALCTGNKAGESNYAFEQFDGRLDKTLAINQTAFDHAVAAGFDGLSNFEWKTGIAALFVGILSLLGLMQRIAEYR